MLKLRNYNLNALGQIFDKALHKYSLYSHNYFVKPDNNFKSVSNMNLVKCRTGNPPSVKSAYGAMNLMAL